MAHLLSSLTSLADVHTLALGKWAPSTCLVSPRFSSKNSGFLKTSSVSGGLWSCLSITLLIVSLAISWGANLKPWPSLSTCCCCFYSKATLRKLFCQGRGKLYLRTFQARRLARGRPSCARTPSLGWNSRETLSSARWDNLSSPIWINTDPSLTRMRGCGRREAILSPTARSSSLSEPPQTSSTWFLSYMFILRK